MNSILEKSLLYKSIAEEIWMQIISGMFAPGSRLPSVRELKMKWKCTGGTIQHAYRELARQGLVVSQVGKGTYVSSHLENNPHGLFPSRKARLFSRTEAFLLEALIAGYSFEEINEAIDLARRQIHTYFIR